MAVPAYNRHESELKILTDIDAIFKLVVSISKNNDLVAKKNKNFIINPLIDNVRKAMYAINNANNYNLNNEYESKIRYNKLLEAFLFLNNIIIDCKFCIAYSNTTYAIQFSKLLNLVQLTKAKLKAWIKSDKTRTI